MDGQRLHRTGREPAERGGSASPALLLLVLPALLALGLPTTARTQDPPPTPRGQLGGPPRLETAPAGPTREPAAFSTAGATPAGRDVPSPAECTVAPIDPGDILDRLAATPGVVETALAHPAVSPAAPTPYVLPAGEPADAATVAGVAATVREYVACLNAGSTARQLALFTEAHLARIVLAGLGQPYPDAVATAEAMMATASAEAARREDTGGIAILAIRDIRVLPDGRAAATLLVDGPDSDSTTTIAFVLAEVGGRWRIDELVVLPDDPIP